MKIYIVDHELPTGIRAISVSGPFFNIPGQVEDAVFGGAFRVLVNRRRCAKPRLYRVALVTVELSSEWVFEPRRTACRAFPFGLRRQATGSIQALTQPVRIGGSILIGHSPHRMISARISGDRFRLCSRRGGSEDPILAVRNRKPTDTEGLYLDLMLRIFFKNPISKTRSIGGND
jgi:hypothetical protein